MIGTSSKKSNLLIENSTIYGNQGSWGGALYIRMNGDVTIRHSTIVNNSATGNYGGILEDTGIEGKFYLQKQPDRE